MKTVFLIVFFGLFSFAAVAQDTATVVEFGDAINELLTAFIQVLVAILIGVALWLTRFLPDALQKFAEAKIREIEARHRATIESALLTGIHEAAEKRGINLKEVSADMKSQIVAESVQWAIGPGASEAVRFFGITPSELSKKALSLIGMEASNVDPNSANTPPAA